jgi:hypothetical protein
MSRRQAGGTSFSARLIWQHHPRPEAITAQHD